jgi:hypothetical protein
MFKKSREEILTILQEVYDKYKVINSQTLSLDGRISLYYVNRYFGNPTHAMIELGFRLKPTKENLIKDLIRCSYNQKLIEKDYQQYGQFTSFQIKKLFGSWNKALHAANLAFKERHINKEDIIQDLQKIYKKHGYISCSLYKKHGKYAVQTIHNYFESWNNALRACAIQPNAIRVKIPNYDRLPMAHSYKLDYAGLPTGQYKRGRDRHFYDSKEEANLSDILYANFINYKPHKKVCDSRRWTCDFYIPEQDQIVETWLEYDGLQEYRNKLQANSRHCHLDKISYYKDNGLSYKILQRGDDILSILGAYINWFKSDFVIDVINYTACNIFCQHTHYKGSSPKGDRYRCGIYYKPFDLLVGIATFGVTSNPNQKVLSLNRFATLDRMHNPDKKHNNFGSFFMSRALKWLKQQGYRGRIISWSDPRFHSGTLYRACNFLLVDSHQKKDYIYINNLGEEYHKSICRVPAGESEQEKARSLNLIKVFIPTKQKWEIQI